MPPGAATNIDHTKFYVNLAMADTEMSNNHAVTWTSNYLYVLLHQIQ